MRPDNEATWVAYEIFLRRPEDAGARRSFLIHLDRWRPVMIGAVRSWRELGVREAEEVVADIIGDIAIEVLEDRWCRGPRTASWFTFLYERIREALRPPDEPMAVEDKERNTLPRPTYVPLHLESKSVLDTLADRRTRMPDDIAETADFVSWFLRRVEPELTPTQFQILVGRLNGDRDATIARRLGLSRDSVRVLLHRVSPKLRGLLAASTTLIHRKTPRRRWRRRAS